ncbi:hypothetical protein QFZ53_002745 [Microbacterium natoriense]|uniref:Uncharacterized protein n=1 Tax=Microbacterium natoriense TaxID=284570 RepID=A0AAW8F099_9MICO|nr:hypothetical protein [Microbacterium natoriense]
MRTSERGTLTASEVAISISSFVAAGDVQAATQAFLQFVNGISTGSKQTFLTLSADPPGDSGPGWSWAIAGIVDLHAQRVGVPAPDWALATSGDCVRGMGPMEPEGGASHRSFPGPRTTPAARGPDRIR